MSLVLTVIAVLAVLVVMIVSRYNSEEGRTKRALAAARWTVVAEAALGEVVKIRGRVRFEGEPLVAPFSRRPCVIWAVDVEERRDKNWVIVLRERADSDFLLEDETGRAKVHMDGALELALVEDGHFSSGTSDDAEPHIVEWIEAHGASTVGWLGFKSTMRYRESVVEADEAVVVMGVVLDKATRTVIGSPPEGPLRISDDPRVVEVP